MRWFSLRRIVSVTQFTPLASFCSSLRSWIFWFIAAYTGIVPKPFKLLGIFTARKRSLRKLCFYTCLSVILFMWGRGLVVSQHALQVTPRGEVEGSGGPTPGGGSPGPHPGRCVCIPACTEADTLPPRGRLLPTGMHSCFFMLSAIYFLVTRRSWLIDWTTCGLCVHFHRFVSLRIRKEHRAEIIDF